MAQQIINIGTLPNDGSGDPLRVAFQKSNDNFTELYGSVAALPVTSVVDSDYTAGTTDYVVLVDNAGVAHTITLDSAVDQGKPYIVKKITSASTVTIDTNNVSCKIDGGDTYVLNSKESVCVVMGDDGNYYITSKFA